MTRRDTPLLIVVTGPPASGKTTIARTLARELDLPLVEKDAIKELLYDEIGTGDREWSKRLGRASYAVMFDWLNVEVGGGRSIVAEANFDTIAARLIRELPPHRVFQVYCTASDDVLLRRYQTRARHPGRVDAQVVEEMRRDDHEGRFAPLQLPGDLAEIDTTSLAEVDLASLIVRIRAEL